MKFSKLSLTLALILTQALLVVCGKINEDFMENGLESHALHDEIRKPIDTEKADAERGVLDCVVNTLGCSSDKDCCGMTPSCTLGICAPSVGGIVGGLLGRAL
uniref:Omega-hexatoxin-Hi2a n=1 Tax=Hadronyche infensa TaxID=153481 RepID=TO2A_HADIN|nr:RecName: Full=Omega-hexatoxin-Hi2a; Short=Omega-HXTX-Hi2a; AltName: Full=Omega-atracotoxin-Hi2a; Short=Omega-AcTx-Hi2a; Flags: Precursor [Hadronyche infensa]AAK17946.1 omega-atracotoxin-Hi2a precursor [Hadronyche infensa]